MEELPRRTALLGSAALVLATLSAEQAHAEIQGQEDVLVAAKLLHGAQDQWAEFQKMSEEAGLAKAGDAITDLMAPQAEQTLEKVLPPGSDIGVDVDGRMVTSVNRVSSGFVRGDTINQVDGIDVENKDQFFKQFKKSKESGNPIKLRFTRRTNAPFTTIVKTLRNIYPQTDSPVAEPDEVESRISKLKMTARLASATTGTLPDLRKTLDKLVVDLDKYGSALPQGETKAKEKKSGAATSTADVSDLFG